MIHLRIEYLTEVARSSRYNDASRAEWPPHPARVYSALVDALHAGEADTEEREALVWLEEQGAPLMTVSDADVRAVRTHFVPVNDKGQMPNGINTTLALLREAEGQVEAATDVKLQRKAKTAINKFTKRLQGNIQSATSLPTKLTDTMAEKVHDGLLERRTRQPRTFPAVVPHEPVFWLHWSEEAPPLVEQALDRIARRVTRIGHSSSLVACRLQAEAPEANLWPLPTGEHVLRIPGPGHLALLEEIYQRYQASHSRVLPMRTANYSRVGSVEMEAAAEPLMGEDWVVLRRLGGDRLPIHRSVDLAMAVRRALLKAIGRAPTCISGHAEDGRKASVPHLAVVPLPFVGHPHATGQLLGVALVPPRDLDREQRTAFYRGLATWLLPFEELPEGEREVTISCGKAAVSFERLLDVSSLSTLKVDTWCRPARSWVSVTPVALGRNPGNLFSPNTNVRERAIAKAEAGIRTSIQEVGLPDPVAVEIHLSSLLPGSKSVNDFPSYPPKRGRLRRTKVHVRVVFGAAIRGPVLLGAGRYLGTGLFRPEVSDASA